MEPTLEMELAGARRLLAPLAEDETLGPDVTNQVEAVMLLLQRIERTSGRVLPYLAADNARAAVLLRDLAPSLPADLQAEIDDHTGGDGPAGAVDGLDIAATNVRNAALRSLLSRAITAHPPVRSRVLACLRQSVEERPW
jgi:hypothetical protein